MAPRERARSPTGKWVARATGRYVVLAESLTHAFGAEMTYQPGDLPIFRAP